MALVAPSRPLSAACHDHAGLAVAAAVVSAGGVLCAAWWEWCCRPRNVPHVPTWLPVLGHLLEYARLIAKGKSLDFWEQCAQRAGGPTFAVRIFGLGYVVCTADPKNVEYILKGNFDNYSKGPRFHRAFLELLGDGIFNADGPQWYHQRKSASRMFSQSAFRNHMLQTFVGHSRRVAELLEGPAARGEAVDMFNMFNRFTLDSIGEVGFGRSLGALENPDNPVLACFDGAQSVVALRFTVTALSWRLMNACRMGIEGRLRRQVKALDAYVYKVVEDAWSKFHDGSAALGAGRDFLSLYMREMSAGGHKDGKLPSDQKLFLRDLVMNFIIAGRDTTAQALTWTLYMLAQHPEVTERAYAELVQTFGEQEDPDFEGLQRLKYTQCVINEVLRLYPSVPKNMKYTLHRDTLPDGTVVPAGCSVSPVPYLMGRMTSIWGEDASEFKPERWLGRNFPSLYDYPVFNAGPRECLGRRMAWLEMKACLAVLLRRYRFRLAAEPSEVRIMESVTLPPLEGLPVIFSPRTPHGDGERGSLGGS